MSFHFCSHSWEVRDIEDGTIVKLRNRDLNADNVPALVDDLFVLVEESGRPNLYLDFADIGLAPSVAISKMVALTSRLDQQGGRLVILNVNPAMLEVLESLQLTDVLEIRNEEVAGRV